MIEKCYTGRFKVDVIPSMMENKSFCNNRCQVPLDRVFNQESPEIVSQRRRHPYRGVVRFEYFCGAERCPQH